MAANATVLELPDGTSEQVAYFGKLFGVTHLPAGRPVGGLVMCSPLFSEFLKNNRREVLLGRRLAAHGFAVQRFHYRGTGNSMGVPEDLTLDSMSADAAAAAVQLTEMAAVDDLATFGTLLGAFPALSIASASSRVALWEPVTDGRRYLKDLFRTLVIVGMSKGRERTSDELESELEATGRLEIAGFAVPRSLSESVRDRKLEVPDGTGEILVVQLGRNTEISRPTARLVQKTETAGRKAAVEPIPARETWWFHQDVDKLRPDVSATLDESMIEPTVDWLTRRRHE